MAKQPISYSILLLVLCFVAGASAWPFSFRKGALAARQIGCPIPVDVDGPCAGSNCINCLSGCCINSLCAPASACFGEGAVSKCVAAPLPVGSDCTLSTCGQCQSGCCSNGICAESEVCGVPACPCPDLEAPAVPAGLLPNAPNTAETSPTVAPPPVVDPSPSPAAPTQAADPTPVEPTQAPADPTPSPAAPSADPTQATDPTPVAPVDPSTSPAAPVDPSPSPDAPSPSPSPSPDAPSPSPDAPTQVAPSPAEPRFDAQPEYPFRSEV